MPDYQNAKIYKLVGHGKIYIGSTTQQLCKRKTGHLTAYKNNNPCTSREIVTDPMHYIELIENFPCNNKEELVVRERYWIEKTECVNKAIPRTQEERDNYNKMYRETNKDKIQKYKEDNKDKITEYRKQYYECNKEQIILRTKSYYADNKDIILEQRKKYAESNRAKIAAQKKKYIEANRDKISEQQKKKYEEKKAKAMQIAELNKITL
jgi:hypothetical protein